MLELWYWPGFPGCGEFVRLALEAGGIAYRDVAIEAGEEGGKKVADDLSTPRDHPPYAPPYLVADGMTIAQTANILLHLGERYGLAPDDPTGRLWINQCQLTIADIVGEAHDTHHPVSSAAYYEDQQEEAKRRAEDFRTQRIPKYLGYFERVLARTGLWLAPDRWSYADLSLFHLVEGLRFAFPQRMATLEPDLPHLIALHDAVAALPPVAAYMASTRRQAFSQGIFRRYPELDAA